MSQDLPKAELYEGVKLLVDNSDSHIQLTQAKLFTLFSIGFQYFLYQSTKNPGAYILRIEDGSLAEKLAKKAKDPSTRKFLQALLASRKLKYDKSMFYLDYFHSSSWNITNDLPLEKIKGALVVKSPNQGPMAAVDLEENELLSIQSKLYLKTLRAPKIITIAYEDIIDDARPLEFPFIKKEKERILSGVTIADDGLLDENDD